MDEIDKALIEGATKGGHVVGAKRVVGQGYCAWSAEANSGYRLKGAACDVKPASLVSPARVPPKVKSPVSAVAVTRKVKGFMVVTG